MKMQQVLVLHAASIGYGYSQAHPCGEEPVHIRYQAEARARNVVAVGHGPAARLVRKGPAVVHEDDPPEPVSGTCAQDPGFRKRQWEVEFCIDQISFVADEEPFGISPNVPPRRSGTAQKAEILFLVSYADLNMNIKSSARIRAQKGRVVPEKLDISAKCMDPLREPVLGEPRASCIDRLDVEARIHCPDPGTEQCLAVEICGGPFEMEPCKPIQPEGGIHYERMTQVDARLGRFTGDIQDLIRA